MLREKPVSISSKQQEAEAADAQREDFRELNHARLARLPLTYFAIATVQEIRRHPKLQANIEGFAKSLGREVNLSKRIEV